MLHKNAALSSILAESVIESLEQEVRMLEDKLHVRDTLLQKERERANAWKVIAKSLMVVDE